VRLDQILERLRASGIAPRLAAPSDTKPRPQLKPPPPPVTRLVGRRRIVSGTKGGGG
jgi:hypothetical protein